jgi:hypothetical protein
MSTAKSLLVRPPFIGLFAFLIVFAFQGLGHTIMIVMEKWFGEEYVYQSAALMGFIGVLMLWYGMKYAGEVAGTWLGFWAGSLLWTGWVEFAFVWNANYLSVPDLMDATVAGEIATKAEYLVMMSSIGVLMATLMFFLFNKDTKCNMFVWFQRNLKMRTGKPNRGYQRSFAAITCLETIYVIWFFYVVLLFLYNEELFGERHPVTYGFFFINTVWAIYLFQRLVRFWKVTTAIRYGIPTAIIAWNSVELIGRWHLVTEFWERPSEFGLEMSLVAAAIAVAAILVIRTPQHTKKARVDDGGVAVGPEGT